MARSLGRRLEKPKSALRAAFQAAFEELWRLAMARGGLRSMGSSGRFHGLGTAGHVGAGE